MGDKNHICTLGDYSKPSHEGYRNTIKLLERNNVVLLRSDTIQLVQNGCSFHKLRSKDPNQHLKDFLKLVDLLDLDLRDRNAKESWALLEYLALYDNESWNDPKDFTKLVKEISLPQDVPSRSNCCLVELENQVQCLIEAHLAPKQHVQVKIQVFQASELRFCYEIVSAEVKVLVLGKSSDLRSSVLTFLAGSGLALASDRLSEDNFLANCEQELCPFNFLLASCTASSSRVESSELQHPQFTKTSPLDSGYTQTDEILDTLTKQVALLAQSFRATLPQTDNQLQTSSNTRNQATVQDGQNSDYFKDKMLLMQAQENGVVLDEEELLFLAGEQTNTFDADMNVMLDDDEPTAQSIFMAILSSTRPANLQDGPSNASILSEKNVIESTSANMGNSNVIPYEQYLTINDISVIPSSASSVPNNAYVLHDNDAYVPPDPLATELNIYKEQVAIYEQRAKFELTLCERKMDEQMSILIQDRNKKEENLKKELHSVKLQLNSTIQNNKIIEETVTALKQEFKQKVSKFLSDFSNLKNLKDKLENKFYLRKAKKAQPALYDSDELLKTHHVLITITSSEEDLELAKTTRMKMNEKMNDSDVFYTATDSVMNASRFHELSTAYNVAMNCAVDLEAESSKLLENILNDDHNTMVKDFSKLEIAHLNLQLKYQHLKENLKNFKSKSSKDVPEFDAFFELGKRDDQIQGHKNTIHSQNLQLKETVIALQERLENFKAENEKTQFKGKLPCVTSNVATPKVSVFEKHAVDVNPLPQPLRNNRSVHNGYLHRLKDTLDTLRETVEEARSNRPSDNSLEYACVYTKQSQELLEYVNASCPKADKKRDKFIATTPFTRKKHVTFTEPLELRATTHQNMSSNNQLNRLMFLLFLLQESTALNSGTMLPDPQANNPPVEYNLVVQIVLWYLDSGCSKHMTGDHSRLRNFVKKFIGTVRFGNDHFGAIIGYGYYVIGDSMISRVYYVDGLGHNLFSVGQFCDSDLEVAFKNHTCFVRDLDGVDLIKGSRGTNLYTISVEDMMRSSSICLLSKASKNKSWLWHRRLNHLNFGTLNDLSRKDLVQGLPRLKFEKDHLCSACQLGKSRKATHKPKMVNTIMEVLHTLHMDLCGLMRVQSINGKKYIFVIVDDYSRFTWVKFLRSKNETPEFVVKLLKLLQLGLSKTVRMFALIMVHKLSIKT
ncbi:retrovirus-related pol polyprotein from transposon TNT 1-94 [Tanacetum coccineum]